MMYIPHSKRLMVVFTLFLLIISTFWANLYISIHSNVGMGVPEDVYSLQLMAADYNPNGRRVLQNSGGMHNLSLGSWVVGTDKTYPAAFAIVNPSNRPVNITSVSLKGEPVGIKLYLHRNMTRPSDPSIVNIDTVEESANTSLFYDDEALTPTPWELSAGAGYDDSKLVYSNNSHSANATKENETWIYDYTNPLVANEGANFVWVEISVAPTVEVETDIYHGLLEIEVEAEFEDGPSVTFMGAGRHYGGPTIRMDEGNTIKLNVSDLKPGTTVVIPDAFAIVNAGSSLLRVTKIDVQGDAEGYMRVYLHGNPYAHAGDYGLPVNTDSTNITYYNGTSYDRSEDGWIIGPGFGYNNTNLLYGNSTHMNTATRTAGHIGAEYNLWMYDQLGENVAVQEQSNFVWVEIAYIFPSEDEMGGGELNVSASLTFHLTSV
ncbi:MAG: hypothetical protein R6U17_02190 [Thermoplasmata archaeon]